MKIAIDLRAMDGPSRYRGIGIYIVFLLNNLLPELKQKNEVVLYVYDKHSINEINKSALSGCKVVIAQKPKLHNLPGIIKKILIGIYPREFSRNNALPEVENYDVFFQPYHEMGIPKAVRQRSILVAYDLIPLIFENEYYRKNNFSINPKTLFKYIRQYAQRKTYHKSLKQFKYASKIIAISNQTKRDLVKYLNIQENQIETIYLGPPNTNDGSVSKSFEKMLTESPYITYVGGIDSRRPIDKFLLRSGDIYINHGIKTIVAGHDFENIHDQSLRKIIEGGKKSGAIITLGHINEAQKDLLIKNALAFVYPTLYEGFGLPLLESFIRKTPVITYKNSSIPEVADNAAVFVTSLDGIPKYVYKLSKDSSFRNKLVKRGQEQAKKFSWSKCAKETQKVIESFNK